MPDLLSLITNGDLGKIFMKFPPILVDGTGCSAGKSGLVDKVLPNEAKGEYSASGSNQESNSWCLASSGEEVP